MSLHPYLILLLSVSSWAVKVDPPREAVCSVQADPSSSQNLEGYVFFQQSRPDDVVLISVNIVGFDRLNQDGSNRYHGMHIHQYGDISDGCKSAGAHFNPTGANHGGPLDAERHFGDLGNIEQDESGIAFVAMRDDNVISLFGPDSIVGRSVVIHERADDLGVLGDKGSLTTGNAGPRLACCVIGLGTSNP